MKPEISIKINRFNPDLGMEGFFQDFLIPSEMAQGMTVVSALKYIQEEIDPTLAFYYSCEQALCRGCLLLINEKICFACTEPVKDGQKLEPLPRLRVLRDLVVKFENSVIDLDVEKCIGCGNCVESCPMDVYELSQSGKAIVRDGPIKPSFSHIMDCIGCHQCEAVCSVQAISIRPRQSS